MKWILERPIAHRGLHSGYTIPENSMVAFEAAIKHNYPFELDIHLLADDNLAVFHDEHLDRATGVKGAISAQNRLQLKKLRLFQSDQSIPLLDDVLDLVNGQVPILIEIKNRNTVGRFESVLWQKLSDYRGEYAVQSFNPFSMSWFRKHAPIVPRGQLSCDFRYVELSRTKKFLLKNLLINWASAPDFIAYDISALPYFATDLAQTLGLPIIAWTIRNQQQQAKAQKVANNIIFEQIKPL
ncbi:MAG: glycerophosphodiester phosphodiesterase [Cyanothece sp. SIO1E1]|nr:glycerophosphodiester phosphodiesterase [Cyanothece sp. SIO1E1]